MPLDDAIPEDDAPDPFTIWLQRGIDAGWIARPECNTHQGPPMREWEADEFEDGADPCILVVRVWRDGYEHVTRPVHPVTDIPLPLEP